MEIPGKVMLYCPLVEAKGTPANLISITPHGYYNLEVTFKGQTHTMFVPITHAALIFAEPEPPREEGFEIER